MLRSLLLGLLTLAAAASCKGGEGGPVVQAGATAGKVVEITGTVTAKRGTESRALTSGNEVSGDDVIETAADSRISIVLAHNNATWSLGPNKKEKVADSMAWSLAKVDQPAMAGIESTSAAGRHAEKAGANTNATATPEAASASATMPPASSEPIAAPVKPATSVEPPSATATPTSGGAKTATRRPAAASPKDEGLGRIGTAGRGGGGGGVGAGAPGGGPSGGGAAMGDSPGKGSLATESQKAPTRPVTARPPPPPPPPAITEEKEAKVDDGPSEIQVLANRDRAKLTACLDASTPTLSVVLEIKSGKASFKLPSGTAPAVVSCLAKVAAGMKPTANLSATLAVKLTK